MKKLRTQREKYKYVNFILLIIYIIGIYVYSQIEENKAQFMKGFAFNSFIFVVLQSVLFCFRHSLQCRKQIAKRKGTTYKGRIIRITIKDGRKIGWYRFPYTYTIIFECWMNGEKKVAESGGYIDNPKDYVPVNRMCEVYVYKNKYYIQDFYKTTKVVKEESVFSELEKKAIYGKIKNWQQKDFLKYDIEEIASLDSGQLIEAESERRIFSLVHAKEYLVFSPEYFTFMDNVRLRTLFIEVRMKSVKSYAVSDFDIIEKISNYAKRIDKMYGESEKEKIHKELTPLITRAIMRKDRRIQIEKIYIIIR